MRKLAGQLFVLVAVASHLASSTLWARSNLGPADCAKPGSFARGPDRCAMDSDSAPNRRSEMSLKSGYCLFDGSTSAVIQPLSRLNMSRFRNLRMRQDGE